MGSGVLAQMAAQQGKRRSPEREIWRRYSRELLLPDRRIDREQAPTSLRNDLGAAESYQDSFVSLLHGWKHG